MKLSEPLKDMFIATAWFFIVMIFLGLGGLFLVKLFAPSDEQLAQERKPQVVKEIDGCKIYRFYDGKYHYVTRCGDKVTTQKNWSESCGKACIRRKSEELVTEDNQ